MGELRQRPDPAVRVLPLSLSCREMAADMEHRALLAFAVPTLLEFGQFLYYRVWTSHYVGAFDPMNIMMYAISVGLAVVVEQKFLAKLLTRW